MPPLRSVPRFLSALAALCVGVAAAAQEAPLAPDTLAQVGPNWDRPLESIGSLRRAVDVTGASDRLGSDVLVTGRVSAGSGDIRANVHEVFLQDGTGGLRVHLPSAASPLARGDSVLVHGRLAFENGMVEIVSSAVRRVAASEEVEPQRLHLMRRRGGGEGPDLEAHEGEMVDVEGRVVQIDSTSAGRLLVLMSGTDLVQVFAYRLRAMPLTFGAVRLGDYVRVRGIAAQHDIAPPYTGSYLVLPLDEDDIRRAGFSPTEYRNGALAIAALLLVALSWAWALRVQVRRRTAALQISEARYGTLLDAAADPVLVFDGRRSGRVGEANRAAQNAFGLAPDGLAADGRAVRLADLAADPEGANAHLLAARRTGASAGVLELRRPDGSTIPYEVASRRLDDGDATSVVSVARDVTERRRYELGLLRAIESAEAAREEAEEAARLKASILANMSHEVRTPLTAILGFADVLVEEVDPSLTEFARAIRTGGQRLLATLSDIVELSRLDAEDASFVAEAVDAVEVVRPVVARLSALADDKGVRMRLRASAPALHVVVAPLALGRIATLVIGNAVKFTDSGEVRVSLHAAGGALVLRVEDTGVGIDEAFLPSLFEAFTQESEGHGRTFEGTGLGLAVTKRLVDGLHGTIRVHSQKGTGSRFEITLPAPPARPPAPPTRHVSPRRVAVPA